MRWVDLPEYTEGAHLITGAGWMPDSERIYFFVQDRAQTWLDLCTAPRSGGESKRLLRDTTEAWVEPPLATQDLRLYRSWPTDLFSYPASGTGWKHLYLYDKDGQLQHPVTQGPVGSAGFPPSR